MEKSVKRFEEAHTRIVKLVEELVTKKNVSLLEIAGIMQATATRIYKEVLSEEEFISLMAMVVDQSTELGAEKETLH
tara:strand:- start:553 stop:783 length:231 start_codon:yes stop_codon:yes gene_type:complete